MLKSTPIPPDAIFQLQLNAMELSILSLSVTTVGTTMAEGIASGRVYLLDALIEMIAHGNTPTHIIDAINSLFDKIKLLGDHYEENPQ